MRLYDTLTGVEREFLPGGGSVKMYVCGITPYAPCHVGHAMSYVIFDVLRRYLEFLGYKVEHVQNFTDIDDKIINRAQQQGISHEEIVEQYIEEFMVNMAALNVKRAHIYPRATKEIPRIIEIIRSLIDKGYAYIFRGDVYFRVTRRPDYGKLSHRTLDKMIAGARVDVGEGKEHPMDFTLWKAAKPGEPFWDSPWGPGRPGWHIECTAMSLAYLGETIDIHGGGQDLVFPHHENEIAQSEAYTEKIPFVSYWVHNGLLHLGADKMSKSLGNLVTVEEALKRYSSDAIRLFFLSAHYRRPLTYSEEGLAPMEKAAERLRHAFRWENTTHGKDVLDPEPYRQRFLQAMDADLNTPQALAALFDLTREINQAAESGVRISKAQRTLRELGGEVLGLTFQGRQLGDVQTAKPFIELLIETRSGLRVARRYDLADRIRSRMAELGVILEDTPQGTRWEYSHLNEHAESGTC